MAQFNNKDQRNLEELLEEKWFDRFKARGAEALGSAKGLGQQVKGGFQQAAGSALTMVDKEKGRELSQQGQSNRGEGKVSGHNAKVQYLQKNIDKRIQSFVDDIKNDIKKLGLDIGNIEMVSGINAALGQLKKSVSGATPPPLPQQSNATPPPLSTQQNGVAANTEGGKPKRRTPSSRYVQPKRKNRYIDHTAPETTNPQFAKKKRKKDEAEENLDKMFWDN